jgi:NAD+ synthase (glutamine-hydrolysing)
MNIALAQLNVHAGDIAVNLTAIHHLIDEAKAQQADLIVFPEMAVGGYLIGDRFLHEGFVQELLAANEQIKAWSKGIAIVWGNIAAHPLNLRNRDGRFGRLNGAYFAHNGQWVKRENGILDGLYVKHALPDYRFFDDSRLFISGVDLARELGLAEEALISPFSLSLNGKTWRIGLEVCEDLWSGDYPINPTALYAKQGVDLILNISASPWTLGKEQSRHKQVQAHAKALGDAMVPLVYVNASGIQNNGKNVLLFDGDSTIFDHHGEVLVEANDAFTQELKIIPWGQASKAEPTPNKLLSGLLAGIKEFDAQVLGSRFNWIIGLSGGLDSSLSAVLLTKALGANRIIGTNMASRFNSDQTKSIAKTLATKLGIRYQEGSIETLTEATLSTVEAFGVQAVADGLPYENIQARLRGHLLSSFAAYQNAVVANNGNKVELALGYATLYGDTIGALSILGDLTKVQLFDLARSINALDGELIDPSLIGTLVNGKYEFGFAPSAELKTNQIDPMKWGYHDYLVRYFTEYPSHHPLDWAQKYADGSWKATPVAQTMIAYGLDDPKAFVKDFRWFIRNWQLAIFKRIQFPPILTVSRGAFGYDYRESQLPPIETPQLKALLDQLDH